MSKDIKASDTYIYIQQTQNVHKLLNYTFTQIYSKSPNYTFTIKRRTNYNLFRQKLSDFASHFSGSPWVLY